MKSVFTLCAVLFLSISTVFSQTTTFEKECRLAGGGGFANGFGNATGGPDTWLQMNYRLSKNFSVAVEYENMGFDRPTFYTSLMQRQGLNKREMAHNYMSFLVKYHLSIQSKILINVVSGWTYMISTEGYYEYQSNINSTSITFRQWSNDGISIPFIGEAFYPIGKIFQAGIRAKYNWNKSIVGDTYSAGLGLSMKL